MVNNNYNWALTTDFEGYSDISGTSSVNANNGSPGVFGEDFYLIELTIENCECLADSTDRKIVGRFGARQTTDALNTLPLSQESLSQLEVAKQKYLQNSGIATNLETSLIDGTFQVVPDKALLAQNEPNPFDHTTSIAYFIPDDVQKASIRVTNIKGQVLRELPIQERGNGQLLLNGTQSVSYTHLTLPTKA